MKKIFFIFLCFLTACRSFNSSEHMKFTRQVSNKLPNLEIVFNNDDLIFYSTAYSFWAGNQAPMGNAAHVGDTERFLKVHIEQQVRNDLIDEYSEPKGYISFRIVGNNSSNVGWLMLPSILSYGTLNLLGMPAGWSDIDLELEARLYDRNKRLIKIYRGLGSDSTVIACYYGYNELDAEKVSVINSVKQALASIKQQINNDQSLLLTKLR